ncbi:MAG: SDR family oxidoreductase [Verrucomicrobiae bacterium]|nr:SDR family oxidoreductase [Verrucomicrobiae bacterium]
MRVNAIAPGFIATELSRSLLEDEAFMSKRIQMSPLRRPGRLEEIAGVAVFLASPAAGFITGQTLVADGGTIITDGS